MKSRIRPITGVAILLAMTVAIVPAGTAVADGPSLLQELPESDNTITRIEVHSDGGATWTLEVRTRLESPEQVESYRTFQSDFRENTSRYLGLYRSRITGVVATGANVTGREMRATNFEAETRIQELPQRWGIVSFEFTWEGFAAHRDESLVVGDVFGSGFFIAEEDTLEIHAPVGYAATAVEPAPNSQEGGVLVWTGQQYFADERPRVVFEPLATTTDESVGESDRPEGMLVGITLLLSAIVGAAAFVVHRRRDESGPEIEPDVESEGPPAADEMGDDPEGFLTDEERVIALLEANGGRMRQADVVEALGWSKAKTSRTLSSMTDDGTITKIRLGRENLVELADEA